MASAPINPQILFDKIPASINPIWPTEEYAIKDFKSGWRIQINLVNVAPHNDKLISSELFMLVYR